MRVGLRGIPAGFIVQRVVEAGFIDQALIQGPHQLTLRPRRRIADSVSPVTPSVDGRDAREELARELALHLGRQVPRRPEQVKVALELRVKAAWEAWEDGVRPLDTGVKVEPKASRTFGVQAQAAVR